MLFWLPAVRDGQLQGRPARVPALANDLHVLRVAVASSALPSTPTPATLATTRQPAALSSAVLSATTTDSTTTATLDAAAFANNSLAAAAFAAAEPSCPSHLLRAAGDGRTPDSPSRLCWRRTAAEPVVLAGWPQRRP